MELKKKKLIEFLKEKNLYNDVADYLIDEMLYQMKLMKLLEADLDERGVTIPINKEATLFNSNPSLGALNAASKQIHTILRKLCIDPRSLTELKLNIKVETDGLDD